MADPRTLARLWWDVWRDGNLELLDEIVADPFVRHTTRETVIRDRAEIRQDMARYRDAHQLSTIRFDSQVAVDDRVWSRVTTTGVNVQAEEPQTMSWLQEFRVADGRLAEMWLLYAIGIDWG